MTSGGRRKKRRAGSAGLAHRGTSSSTSPRHRADLGPYIAFALIWVFASALAYLILPEQAAVTSAAIVAGFAVYVTWCTAQAALGRKLMAWQRGLVRLPLILARGGRKHVDHVKGEPVARVAFAIGLGASILLVGLTVFVALRS